MLLFYIFPFFLCWGSFLNVVGYRLIAQVSLLKPWSFCPHCTNLIHWYDNIPVVSWFILLGKCRTCRNPISFLYPLIEIMTAVLLCWLYVAIPHHYFFAYFIYISALMVTFRSDIETMLISRWATVFLIPVVWILSACGLLPISLFQSIVGAVCGYLFLFAINFAFFWKKGYHGIGAGDFDLLAFIGAFSGVIGCWASITIGSTIGSVCGLFYMLYASYTQQKMQTSIPFGPFLATGAIMYLFFQKNIMSFLLDYYC